MDFGIDDGGIPDTITNTCTGPAREEVVIPDYGETETQSFDFIDDEEVLWRIIPVDEYDDCSDMVWALGKGDKKNCFKSLVRSFEKS